MVDYIPGEKGLAVAQGIRPSLAAELAFERGFYEGDYTVVAESKVLSVGRWNRFGEPPRRSGPAKS